MLTLEGPDVDVWCLDVDQEPQVVSNLEDVHLGWLSEAEMRRYHRLQLPRPRQHFLLGKVFTRRVLSRYADMAPGAWQFSVNPHGKPFLAETAPGSPTPGLHFNLSHSRGRFVLAVSRMPVLGVDVEFSARKRRVSRLARRYFSRSECQWLLGLAPADQQAAFYQLWTLKEAFMKARGLGQALPLNAFSFDLSRAGVIGLQPDENAESETGISASHWRCWRLADPLQGSDVDSLYALALVVGDPVQQRLPANACLSFYRYGVEENECALPVEILAASDPP